MELSDYKTAYNVARLVDAKLLASDFLPDSLAVIVHEEGTQLSFRSAFMTEWKDWIFIFTEHHKFHVYHKSDLMFYRNYVGQEVEKQKGTGHTDKCMMCGKLDDVENLIYGSEPYDTWKILCQDCDELKDADHQELWAELNQKGCWNDEKEEYEPWGFVWGKPNLSHLEKAIATVIKKKPEDETAIGNWLHSVSLAFPETPMKLVMDEDYEPIYLAIYQTGIGSFS